MKSNIRLKSRMGEGARACDELSRAGRGGDAEPERLADTPPLRLSPSRRGFSLVELLVVISIIALLITTAFVVFGDALGNAKRNATVATIKKVDELLTTRLD